MLNRDTDALFEGHPSAYALPSEVLAARAAVLQLSERARLARLALNEAEAAASHSRSAASGELLAAALAGTPLPESPGRTVAAAKAAREVAVAEASVTADAVAAGERWIKATLVRSEDAILAALRPALDEVVEAVRATAPALAGIEIGNAEAVMRTPATVKAYQALAEAHRRYEQIRAAQLALHRLRTHGRLPDRAEIRNHRHVRPAADLTGAARLRDLVERGAELWLPTREQLAATRPDASQLGKPMEVTSERGNQHVHRRAVAEPIEV
jgi:hypothetical protein